MKIEGSVAPVSEAATGATAANLRPVQVANDVRSQRSTSGAEARHEGEDEVAVVAPGLDGHGPAAVTDAAIIATPPRAVDDGMAKEEELIERLIEVNLALREDLIAEKTASAHALLHIVRL